MSTFFERWQENNLRRRILKTSGENYTSGPVASKQFVGVLFLARDLPMIQSVMRFISKVEALGQPCVSIGFVPRRISPKVDYGHKHFSQTDQNLLGLPNNRHIVQFSRRNFSTLINLDFEETLPLHYLCGRILARYKMGMSKEYPDLYDVRILPSEDDNYDETLEKALDLFEKTIART